MRWLRYEEPGCGLEKVFIPFGRFEASPYLEVDPGRCGLRLSPSRNRAIMQRICSSRDRALGARADCIHSLGLLISVLTLRGHGCLTRGIEYGKIGAW